jgi:hypothetical protein
LPARPLPELLPIKTRERSMAISLLFSGHMIDQPGRTEPRFPASLEDAARRRIAKAVESYATPDSQSRESETSAETPAVETPGVEVPGVEIPGVDAPDVEASTIEIPGVETPGVLGFASGARGGDLLFHEECRRRRIGTVVALPFEPDVFVKTSVAIKETKWESRFWDVWNTTPAERRHVLGLPVTQKDAYAICNTRLLELARQHGRIHLIAFWDGKNGGKGGTSDLVSIAKTLAGDEPDIFSPQDIQD